MEVNFLGTGIMTTTRRSTSFVVDKTILFDIGNGVTNAIAQNGLLTENITHIVVSHHHTDHFADIVYFLHRKQLMGGLSGKKLTIIGPSETKAKVDALEILFMGDIIDGRMGGLENFYQKQNIHFIELKDKESTAIESGGKKYNLTAYKVVHNTGKCNAYVLKDNKTSLGYSGDSEWSNEIKSIIKNSKNWILEANDLVALPSFHIGFDEIITEAKSKKDTSFYVVHRKDKEYKTELKNIFIPNDGEVINI